ncbi:MAG: 3-hydroxyacyl-CoA dehydrogenase NAD-binding domain-containing protein [Eubacterium sp.]|uniref:3-hydroxyacyl-CoA dehydrogenase NAD-binding domain-containing protein n=1 Tax=Eubacterium sp. TaxID=142586 RepID=UPI003991EB7F
MVVIGAGTMGPGNRTRHLLRQKVTTVIYVTSMQEFAAEGGKDKIAKVYARLVAKGKMTQEDVDGILDKITTRS